MVYISSKDISNLVKGSSDLRDLENTAEGLTKFKVKTLEIYGTDLSAILCTGTILHRVYEQLSWTPRDL